MFSINHGDGLGITVPSILTFVGIKNYMDILKRIVVVFSMIFNICVFLLKQIEFFANLDSIDLWKFLGLSQTEPLSFLEFRPS